MDVSELYAVRTLYSVFYSPVSTAASYLTTALKVRQILPPDIATALDSALRQYHSSAPDLLSPFVLSLLSELSAQDAPLILSKVLIGLVASMKTQVEVSLTQSESWIDPVAFTVFFNEHWKSLNPLLLTSFSVVIDQSFGPSKPEYR